MTDKNSSSMLPILEKLIAFDTTSNKSNSEIILWISNFLANRDIDSNIVRSPCGNKHGLFATIGPRVDGGVILSGHSDVVPAEYTMWRSDPFKLSQKGARLYGRGTTDMKGFIATCLASIDEIDQSKLQRPLHLLISYDEELACAGAQTLIDAFLEDRLMPSAAIIGEPTSCRVIGAHKSLDVLRVYAQGTAGHASQLTEWRNAIECAAAAIASICETAASLIGDTTKTGGTQSSSINVGKITGGKAFNIKADSCQFEFEVRAYSNAERLQIIDECLERIQTTTAALGLGHVNTVVEHIAQVPPLERHANSCAETLGLEISGGQSVGAVSYGTEAGFFQRAGIPAIVMGPGDIAQAHTSDEFIELGELASFKKILSHLVSRLTSGKNEFDD